tara:strand:+ start:308 stop:481 length:174 start_codon:yes stop_codon:yes gene_type:complete
MKEKLDNMPPLDISNNNNEIYDFIKKFDIYLKNKYQNNSQLDFRVIIKNSEIIFKEN